MGTLDDDKYEKLVILLWGKPKVGKTVLATQFPNPFVVDLEDGLRSVKSLRRKWELNFNFDVIMIDQHPTEDEDFIKLCGKTLAKEDAWTKAKTLIGVLSRKMPENGTLIIDHLTCLADYLLVYIRKLIGREKLQIQDWGTFVEKLQDVMTAIKDAKCTVIMIGHEEYVKDNLEDTLERLLLVPTKMRNRIPAVVSDSLFMRAEVRGARNARRVIRRLQVIPDERTPTGSRTLIPDIENPTYAKMRPFLTENLERDLGEPTWTPPND